MEVTWSPVDQFIRAEGLQFDLLGDSRATPEQMRLNAILLSRLGLSYPEVLGLSREFPVQAHSFRPMDRVGPDGNRKVQIVAELMQRREVRLDPKDKDSPTFVFRGGTTIILTHEGVVRYAIQKKLGKDNDTNKRLRRQREYYSTIDANSSRATYFEGPTLESRMLNFNLIHRGY